MPDTAVQDAFWIGESHQVEPSLNRVTGPNGVTRLEPKVMLVLACLAKQPRVIETIRRPAIG